MTRMDLNDARVLVTGASAGLGRELAVVLAGRGARLALVARREAALRDLADELRGRGLHAPLVLAADLTQAGVPATVGAAALGGLGGLDVLINNAGTHFVDALARVADGPPARDVFEIHLWAPLALTSAVLPSMLTQGQGTIVNVTAGMASLPAPFAGYYAASKSALAQVTRSLRHELRHTPIRVLEFCPGPNDTAGRNQGYGAVPWKTKPRSLRAASPRKTAEVAVRALERGSRRVTYPRIARLPGEVPAIGRLLTALAARAIDTSGSVDTGRQ